MKKINDNTIVHVVPGFGASVREVKELLKNCHASNVGVINPTDDYVTFAFFYKMGKAYNVKAATQRKWIEEDDKAVSLFSSLAEAGLRTEAMYIRNFFVRRNKAVLDYPKEKDTPGDHPYHMAYAPAPKPLTGTSDESEES